MTKSTHQPKQARVSLRKKPSQSRSQLTLHALQDAFVRVLIERGYEKMTIREVVSVAGVGIGTFYDYMPNLRALAASTINQRCMATALVLKNQMAQHSGLSVTETVEHLLKALVTQGFSNPKEVDHFSMRTAKDNQPTIKPIKADTNHCDEADSAELTGRIKCTAKETLATIPMNPAHLDTASLAS